MDDIVKAALAKWPNVPHCYGWLGLDARGDWYMRDDGTQAAGPFALPANQPGVSSKGSRLLHDKLVAFIHRNYAADDAGQWYFQNGPQRVYVELEAAPYVWRLQSDGRVAAHTGTPAGTVRQSLLDNLGRLYLVTDLGLGIVHTSDMHIAADAVERGEWTPQEVDTNELESQYAFILSPQRAQSGRSVANR